MTQRLSASRLNEYLACAHAAALWLDGVEPPGDENASLELLRKKGFEHEAVVLTRLEAEYGPALAIPDRAPAAEKAEATRAAMARGAPLIYQAALYNDRWVGFPDFLVRTGEGPDGRALYEPEDAKLSTRAKAEHLIQLGIYRKLIIDFGGAPGPSGAIHVGGGKAPERFRLEDTAHITARYMGEFETFADAPLRNTRPLPNGNCGRCAFQTRCEAEWRQADSPTFVAGLRSDQLLTLEKAGVTTLEGVANIGLNMRVPGIGDEALRKLVAQARLQAQARQSGEHVVEPLRPEPGRGFALLPPPAAGDLFFDMEGYPHDPGGLEYLFGLYGPLGHAGEDAFRGIWAHDAAEEKIAFEALMDLFMRHLQRYPNAHIYHYAPYETVALKKLASRYATREAELDRLLRERRFVDLYRVAKQGLRASTESYSLKALEKIYWGKRSGEVTNAGDSIVEYERWRETRDPAILEAIERYNDDDCVSTAKLRDWLETLRPASADYNGAEPGESQPDPEAEARSAREAFEAQRRDLAARVRASKFGTEAFRNLVAELLWFHQRANKPQWWSLFDRQTWSDEELIDDIEGLGGLELVSRETLAKPARSDLATYRFPPQDTKLRVGQTCKIAATLEPAGVIQELDAAAGSIVLKRGSKAGEFPPMCGISPDGPIDQNGLIEAILAFAERVATGDLADDQALTDLLLRALPQIAGAAQGKSVLAAGEDLVAGVVRAVGGLQTSHLFIQGPPGTGKTYTSSKAILELLKSGAHVAVSSNSHKAINNLLAAVESRAEEDGFALQGVKKATRGDPETEIDGKFIGNVYNSADTAGFPLVGGTAFHFCKSDREFDYLFVDEAGQVCLANLVAMAGCARNIVLIGDQMQLPQPVQGVHPGETGFSCLDYLLQGRPTVPPERGVLLDVSWRMHPAVCSLISDAVYEGRLSSHPTATTRAVLDVPGLPSAGVIHMPVAHEGCRQASRQEADAIAELVARLLSGGFRDERGHERRMALSDLLVVAPYNLQVNLLKERLPDGARVGTVDKFQGQEAPVVIVSMATSRGSEAPRGTEFLFNKNRLNVAISRAQCLAIVVASERLLEGAGGSVEDLVRLDLLARVEAGPQAGRQVEGRR